MVWDLTDYPKALKNFDALIKKKAIEIGNALLEEGYSDTRAIPIAISQAKEWAANATEEEKWKFEQQANPTKAEHYKKVNRILLPNDVLVYYNKHRWFVQTNGAPKAAESFDTREEAVEQAKKIAHDKKSRERLYHKDERPPSL